MNVPNYNNKDELSDMSAMRPDDSLVWLTSYSDLVTLLLCFFILFFSIYAKKEIEDVRKKAVTATEEKIKAITESQTLDLIAQQLDEKFSKLENVYSLVHQLPDINTIKKKDHFLIVFSDGNFFNPGSFKLNLYGQYKMALVLEKLITFADKLHIEVQGHADGTPIVNDYREKGFSTNMELSVLRAIEVFKFFKLYGFPEENLAVSGFSNSRPIIDEQEDDETILGRNRRITFRVEGK